MSNKNLGTPDAPLSIRSDEDEKILLDQLKDIVANAGFTVLTCHQKVGSGYLPLSYSIGMAKKNFPDVLIVGALPEEFMANVVDITCSDWIDGKADPKGPQLDRLEGTDGKSKAAVAVRHLNAEAIAGVSDLTFLEKYYGTMPAMVQLLIPDSEGRYPTDEGYDQQSFPQPLLEEFISVTGTH